ncbi:MAG: methyltransferase domain-containing protein [Alphaproteobacteria bacterium]|nr:methyltransferase domain-containing protein [Alphaproteobacteria bacterium]
MTALDPWYLEALRCPVDRSTLSWDGTRLVSAAGRTYPVVDGLPVMLVAEEAQTMDIARASIERAHGNLDVIDQRAPEYYLETLGISDEEKRRLVELATQRLGKIDPAVSLLVGGTSGNAYAHLIGNASLQEYPIPRIELPPGPGPSFLDIGCNWGRWCIAAARAGYSVVGIDPSLGSAMAARRVARELGLDIRYVVGDARWLPFAETSFDNVHSYSVLQHFSKENARKALDEAGRVLRPGGIAKIQMANRLGVRSLQHQVRRGFREPVVFEVRYWSVGDLRRTFEAAIGPTDITVDCYFGLGWQWVDMKYMLGKHKPILFASEMLKRLSRFFPPLRHVADSVFCTATKPSRSR